MFDLVLKQVPAPKLDPDARIPLNDACLALAATYGAQLDRYSRLVQVEGLDLQGFIARAREAAATEDPVQTLIGSLENDTPLDAEDPQR